MQAWEYDVIYIDPNDLRQKQSGTPLATRALNRMGQGWEALAVVDLDNARKAIPFKRPRERSTLAAPVGALALHWLGLPGGRPFIILNGC